MQVSRRTKFSLAQLLAVIERPTVSVIFDKFGLDTDTVTSPENIAGEITDANAQALSDLIIELIQTNKTIRNGVSPKYKFDDQFAILEKSLLLDGYQIEEKTIKALDPNFVGVEAVEDALIKEIDDSTLQNKAGVKQAVKASADDFVKAQPDYNGSLTNIRIALETLVREIALEKGSDIVVETVVYESVTSKEWLARQKKQERTAARRDSIAAAEELKQIAELDSLKKLNLEDKFIEEFVRKNRPIPIKRTFKIRKAVKAKVAIIEEQLKVNPNYFVEEDKPILAILQRFKESWKGKVVVTDITQSMNPYLEEVLIWHLLNLKQGEHTKYLFFNDLI